MAGPSLDLFYLDLCSAYGFDLAALSCLGSIASGIVYGTNPPFAAGDLFAFYPKFGGALQAVTGDLTAGSPVVAGTNTSGLAAGMAVKPNANIPAGATILSVDSGTQFTLSQAATADATAAQVQVFANPLAPYVVINAYIALASSSLLQARWLDSWQIAMCWYVAHYLTLWLRSDGDIYSTPGKAAAAGLAQGITTSASAGPVSESVQLVPGFDNWGAWAQTEYGVQLVGMAKVVGSGPIWVG